MKKNSRGSNAKKVTIDGIVFDSGDEGKYYEYLKSSKASGYIKDFYMQPRYVIQGGFKYEGKAIREIVYQADFVVVNLEGDDHVIDVKGFSTPEALIKRKMFLKVHPELKLSWVSYVKKHGGFLDYFELQKIRRKNKKLKEGRCQLKSK